MSARTAAERRHRRIRRLVDELSLEPRAIRSLAQLAEEVGSSPRTLQRVLPAGFSVWRRQYMLTWAIEKLASGETVGAVALGAGYGSPGAFSSAFGELMGMPPREARRAFKAVAWLSGTRRWDVVFEDPAKAQRWSRRDTQSAVTLLETWHGDRITDLGDLVLKNVTPPTVQLWVRDARIRLFDSPDEVLARDGWTDSAGRFHSAAERHAAWLRELPRGAASQALDDVRRRHAHEHLRGKERDAVLASFDGTPLTHLESGLPGSSRRTEARLERGLRRLMPLVSAAFEDWAVGRNP